MKSIGLKLTLMVICGLLSGILITVGVSLFLASGVITDEVLGKVERSVELEANRIDSWLIYHSANMITLANILSTEAEGNEDSVRQILSNVMNENQSYSDVYIGYTNNTAIMGSGFAIWELYDWWRATERPWYRLAMTDIRKPHITEPYVDSNTGELCITISQAVTHEGQVIGVVGADILLPELINKVLSINLDGYGYAMLKKSNGNIIVGEGIYAPSPDGDFQNIATMFGGQYADMWRNVTQSNAPYLATDSDGVDKYYFGRSIDTTDWYLLVILPRSVVNEPIINMILITIPITILITIIVALLMYLVVSKLISKPIRQLAYVADNVSNGNLDVNIETTSADEIGLLSGSFSKMVITINNLVKELSLMGKSINIEGNIDARADSSGFSGSYKELVNVVNELLGGIVNEVMILMGAMNEFGKGNLNADIPKLPGKKIIINQNLDTLKKNIQSVTNDVNLLANNAINGNLSYKIDESNYMGDWKAQMVSLNKVMDAVHAPFFEIKAVINNLSNGVFDKRVLR
jgi:methyl-accepting chemotaxis protein